MQKLTAFPLIALLVFAACDDGSQQNTRPDADIDAAPTNDGGVVDDTPPDTTITQAPPVATKDPSSTFEFSSTEAGMLRCRIDGAAYAACTSPDTRVLSEGEHTFEVVAVDLAGNEDPTPATHAWTIDTTPPETTITDAPAAPLDSSADASFSFESEEGALFECSLDGSSFALCASPFTATGLADAEHTFRVRAFDAVGNADPTPASHTWTIDTTFPETVIGSGPSGATSSTGAVFSFSSVDGISFECRVDGGAWQACTTGVELSGLADGPHTFEVRARDATGNYDPSPASQTWTVDTVDPDTSIVSGPAGSVPSDDATFTFSSTEGGATYECSLDGAAFAACPSPATFSGLSQGEHTLRVRAIDAAGNADASPVTRTWTVDTQGPTVAITNGPSDPSNATTAVFTFASADPVATFQCRLGVAAAYAACASGESLSGLSEGTHTFYVRAADAAGNVGPAASYSWTIDVGGPVVTITTNPQNPSGATMPRFTFTANEAGATFECRVDGAAYQGCPADVTLPALTDGEKTFYVRATDVAGNTGTPATYTWLVDSTPPAISIDATPDVLTNDATPTFSFTAIDATAVTFECRIGAGAAYSACASPFTFPAQTDGPKTFYVRATDAVENTALPATFAWTIDATDPVIAIGTRPDELSTDPSPSFSFSSVDGSVAFECRIGASAAYAPCTSPAAYGPLADGPHTFYVRGRDAAGNVTVPSTYSWIIDATDPVVVIGSTPDVLTNSSTPTFTFSATDASTVTFECKIGASAAFGPCQSPNAYPVQTDGPKTFYVRGTDEAGNVSAVVTYDWTIDTGEPDTTIGSGPNGAVSSTGATFAFSSDEGGATYQCRIDSGAWGDCTSSRVLTGLTQGEHTFDVRAVDPAGNIDASPASRTWTVDTVNPDTTIASGPTGTVAQTGATFTFTSDEAGATFECRLDLADWAGCDTPLPLSGLGQGPHTLRVRASDAAENTDASPSTRTWTVDTQGPTVTIATGPESPTNSTSAVFTFTASEADSTFECRVDPATSFSSCSSGDTFTASEGARTFYVRATDTVGNLGTAATFTWSVDVTAPSLSITSGPNGTVSDSAATFAFTATDALSVTYSCRVDGTVANYSNCTSPRSYAGPLDQGAHTFYVRATDAAGNTAVVERTWTVDTVKPVVTINDPTPAVLSTAVGATFSFSAVDATSVGFECRVDGTAANYAACTSPEVYAGPLADGPHTFYVRGTDAAGNRHVATHAWTIDATDPVVSIAIRPKTLTSGTGAYFTFSAVDVSSVVFECRVDGTDASYASCTSPRNYAGPYGDGPHTFYVRGTDAAGNVGTAQYTWTVDATAPVVTIDGATPAAMTNAQTATFSFSATDANAVSFHCRIDGSVANYTSCTSSKLYAGPIADGAHTFYVRGTDAAGNTDVATHEWTVDATDPVVTIGATKPAAMTSNKRATFSFSADDATAVRFECRIDGTTATYSNCTSLKTYAGPIPEGPHTFYVRGTDAAGNTGVASYPWTVDSFDPVVTIGSPTPALFSNETSATFVFSATDLHTVTFECRLDGTDVNYADCTSGQTYAGPISQAQHRFYVRGTDEAGNSHVDFHAWTIDTTRPAVSISAPANGSTSRNGRPTMTFVATDANRDTVECRIDGEAYAACTSPRTFLAGSTTLASGTHTARVRATDSAGNVRVRSTTWTVDRTAPQTTITSGPASPWPVNYATVTFTSNEAGSSFLCSSDGGANYVSCSSPWDVSGMVWGATARIRVKATDPIGNEDATPASHNVSVQRGLALYYPYPKKAANFSPLGSAHDGVEASGVRYVTGPFGHSALMSDGTGSQVTFADTVTPMSAGTKYTVATWFRSRGLAASGGAFLLDFRSGSAGTGGCEVYHGVRSAGSLYACCSGEPNFSACTAVSIGDTATWHHLALVYDGTAHGAGGGSDVLVYVDGQLAATLANPNKDDIFNSRMLTDMVVGNNSSFYVDETRVYTNAYNQGELCKEVIGGSWNGDNCQLPLPGVHIPFDDPKQLNVGSWNGDPTWGQEGPAPYRTGIIERGAQFLSSISSYFLFYGNQTPFMRSAKHTVGAWFYDTSSIRRGGQVFNFAPGKTTGIWVSHPDETERLEVCFRGMDASGLARTQCATVAYEAGTWNHIAVGHTGASPTKGGDVQVYLNGKPVLVIDNSEAWNIFASVGPLQVGYNSNMLIDDVKAYDMVFSDEVMCTHVAGGIWTKGSCEKP